MTRRSQHCAHAVLSHVWTVTFGFEAMNCCRLVVKDMSGAAGALLEARRVMKDDFGIDHVTIQVDDEALHVKKGPAQCITAKRWSQSDGTVQAKSVAPP
jgi:hypothetical protein